MKHGSLFSGIGGFDLASEWMGWENVFHCEIAEFPRKILNYYWPNTISYENIKETDFTIHRGGIDILTGGFPCQPFSMAGKRKGTEDERHLWPEMLRAIREIQPSWIVGENVFGIVNWDAGLVFEQVQSDLEAEGYEVQAFILPAAAVNAPHRRDRVWFVAKNSKCDGCVQREFKQEGAEIWKQWNTGSRNKNGVCLSKRPTPDTPSDGLNDQPSTGNNEIGQDNKQSRTQRERTFKGFGNEWDATDTNITRCKNRAEQHRWQSASCRKGEHCPCGYCIGFITNTDSQRQEWEREQGLVRETRQRREERLEQLDYFKHQWKEFPTQSPICSGDDGLPTELDGITFSKWRNESIKGYGNAIVPQVVLQIFKAIQEYESQR